jgi:hypothetical protein
MSAKVVCMGSIKLRRSNFPQPSDIFAIIYGREGKGCGFERNDWVSDPRNPKQKGDYPGSIIRKGGDKFKIFEQHRKGKRKSNA